MTDHSARFDLSALRLHISKMNDRILMRLHDRAGFPLNAPVYRAGAIPLPEHPGMSLLEFAILGLERYHASLGRYEFPDQFPLVSEALPPAAAERVVAAAAPPHAAIAVRERLLPWYVDVVLPTLCDASEDTSTFGETAYVDADLLELLNERINVGRAVAMAKLESDPSIRDILDDANALTERLRDTRREDEVLAAVVEAATRYAVDPNLARAVFRWVIDRVLELEVVYLQQLTDR
jgi:monofunctional chorismate mutase